MRQEIEAFETREIVTADESGEVVPQEASDLVRGFQQEALAPSTSQAYARDMARFKAWCDRRGVAALPAEPVVVAEYVAEHGAQRDQDGVPAFSGATISRWVASLNKAHRRLGIVAPGDYPEVEATLNGVRRVTGRERPTRRALPLLTEDLRKVLAALPRRTFPAGVGGLRDACLLLFGFTGAFRREELAGLVVGDVQVQGGRGLHVRVRFSKTDQEGEGHVKALPRGHAPETCPMCAYVWWMRVLAAGEDRAEVMKVLLSGYESPQHVCRGQIPSVAAGRPLFSPVGKGGRVGERPLTGHGVNWIVKSRVQDTGMDPTGFSGHSLRAGFVTQALLGGASAHEIMRQTGHSNPATVEIYAREHAPEQNNAVSRLGL